MSRLHTRPDQAILYETDDGKYRAAFSTDTGKGLALGNPSPPIHITSVYGRTVSGWSPVNISGEIREGWEQDIIKLMGESNG